ncbi:hypothetical protein [Paenibacillus algicola]|nr:hypothetical protein [Paenibacillus algicola]
MTELVRSNNDFSLVQTLSGHSSSDMIMRYSKPSEEDKLRAVEGLYKN